MIAASCDIMSVDVGSDSKMMNVIKDTYKNVLNSNSVNQDNVCTGKGVRFGGLEAYDTSLAFGIAGTVRFIEKRCSNYQLLRATHLESGGSKKSVIIKGFSKRSYNIAKYLIENDSHFKIVGITQDGVGIINYK
jgi:glutamate dehydrogenase/leucine dehydrogenase